MRRGLKGIFSGKALPVPGAFNTASAMMIERAGFGAVYISGAGLSNSNGLPDAGLLTLADTVRLASTIIKAIEIPCIVDIDTGFGDAARVKETVRSFEEAGAGAVQME